MNRLPQFFRNVFVVAITLAVSLVAGSASVADPGWPNVLFIAVDDLKPTIGAFGDPVAQTPNIDRLASMGTAFTNAHCQQAICAPSRVSIMTGLRPDATKVWDLKTQFRDHLPDAVTLPQLFKQAGYSAVGMGKIYDSRSAGGDKVMDAISWSEPYTQVNARSQGTLSYLNPETVAYVEKVRRENPDAPKGWHKQIQLIWPDGKPAVDRADVPDGAYIDGAIANEAIRRLNGFAESGESFFLAVGFQKPHLPFNAPEKYWQMYDRDALPMPEFTSAPEGAPEYAPQPGWELRYQYDVPRSGPISLDRQRELIHGYYACTSYIDALVGRMLETLERNGQIENTIIVLWGDHGWHLGDHDIWCKHTNYEQATRSPLIVVAPGVGQAGGVSRAPVELVDVYPTLVDLASLEPAGELHGVSLRPLMDDPSGSVKDVAVSQYPRDGRPPARMGYAFRDHRYRLVRWRLMDTRIGETDGPVEATELYDYETDPLETRNLADDPAYAEVLVDMEAKAEAFRAKLSAAAAGQ
jgi:arylsulfatase A-like enzyme